MILDQISVLNAKHIVLASGSPRRKELLKMLGLSFEIVVSGFEETLNKSDFKCASDYVCENAKQKAEAVSQLDSVINSCDLVIGCDTVVVHDGKILEKPDNEAHAFQMLKQLSGSCHQVISAVALFSRNAPNHPLSLTKLFHETTTVEFALLDADLISAYVKTGEPMDKAGGYGIQSVAGSFVKRIDGCFYNVVGLPFYRISTEIRDLLDTGKL